MDDLAPELPAARRQVPLPSGPARRATIELLAPIEAVWQLLTTTSAWSPGEPAGVGVEVVEARAPDLVTWRVDGDARGHVAWELDDLDAVTFAHSRWWLAPTRGGAGILERLSDRAAARRHLLMVRGVAGLLAAGLGAELLVVRTREGVHDPIGPGLRPPPGPPAGP